MKKKKQKVQMPAGIRNKLMAAVSMLMVSVIMLVSSTYAWFTLSTAPEVTGISTSVGANGNLEMALLTSGKAASGENTNDAVPNTFADPTLITSAVGDSSAATNNVVKSNITWGNLVDLSAADYHLSDIALMPAAANITTTDVDTTGKIELSSILKTAVYGADGRVNKLDANTLSGVYTGDKWDPTNGTYGVRAVGSASTMSAEQVAYNAAKGAYATNLAGAHSGITSSISNNLGILATLVSAEDTDTITADQKTAALSIIGGTKSDLQTIASAYKNYMIAYAATVKSGNEFTTIKQTISNCSISTLKDYTTTYADYLPSGAATKIEALATAYKTVSDAETTISAAEADVTQMSGIKNAVKSVVGTTTPNKNDLINPNKTVYWEGGVISTIAENIGVYLLASKTSVTATVYGGAQGTKAALPATVADHTFDGGAVASITDTYGYVLDFAFRTNASGSKLQLQTDAMNRVYAEQNQDANLATMGAGSTVTYTYNTAAKSTTTQAETLLNAIKLVFFDPDNGTVYAKAKLSDVKAGADSATAKIVLDTTATDATKDDIVALNQNEAKKVSVLVYMDGETVDNKAAVNAQSAGTLKINLQFSSDKELVPMNNSTLKTMQKPAP